MKYDLGKGIKRGAARVLGDFSRSMTQLLTRKSFESISVNELCELAQYPRATFYNYFDDKYDLLDYCWHCVSEQIFADECRRIPQDELPCALFDRLCDFTAANICDIRSVLENNDARGYAAASFSSFLAARLCCIFEGCSAQGRIPREIAAEHFGSTLILVWRRCCLDSSGTKAQAHSYLRCLLSGAQSA